MEERIEVAFHLEDTYWGYRVVFDEVIHMTNECVLQTEYNIETGYPEKIYFVQKNVEDDYKYHGEGTA